MTQMTMTGEDWLSDRDRKECNDASSPRRDDDSRYRLTSDIRDYASWLERVYR